MKTGIYRKISAVILACTLVVTNAMFAGQASADAPASNVLEGRTSGTVVASSADYNGFGPYTIEEGGYGSQALTDGDRTATVPVLNGFAAWWGQPAVKTGQLYDLGGRYDLTDIAAYVDAGTVTGVRVYVGDHAGDLASPSHLAATLALTDLNKTVAIAPTAGRYVLFMFTEVADNGTAKVAELEAYGSAAAGAGAIGPDNVALGLKADLVKITNTDGDLANLQDFSYTIGDSIKTALTDGRTSNTPGSKDWQWDGKLWSGKNGLSYVIGYDLGEPTALSRFAMTTIVGQQADSWRVYVSDTPDHRFDSAAVCSTSGGMSATSFNAGCSLAEQKVGRYVTFVVKAGGSQDTFFPAEMEIYGSKSAVLGVTDGATYTAAVTPELLNVTATLAKDGGEANAYAADTPISDSGSYTLVATDDAGRVQQVRFTVDLPAPGSVNVLSGKVGTGVAVSDKNYSSFAPFVFASDSNSDTKYSGYAFTDGVLDKAIPIFNEFSRWWHQPDVKSGLLYDLGASFDLSRVSVYADGSLLKGVQVYIGQHEGDLATSANLAANIAADQLNGKLDITPRTGRYVLFLFANVASASDYVAKVAEVQAFGESSATAAGSGYDNIALGRKPYKIEFTGTDGNLSTLTDSQASDAVRATMTDGLVSAVPGSDAWQWDVGKVWSGKMGAKYVVRFALDRHYAVSRFTFSTPAGQSPESWSVYLSDDSSSIEGAPACTSLSGTELTFNYVCSLPVARTAKYVTFVLKAVTKMDALWMNEFQIFGAPSDVWGVADGTAYNASVTPKFDEATTTATLQKGDGGADSFTSGTQIAADGSYRLVATNSSTNVTTTVNFTIDKSAPAIEGITDGGHYDSSVMPIISDTSAVTATLLVDANLRTAYPVAFVSGTEIIANGHYVLTAKDVAGNTTTVNFTIDNPQASVNEFKPPYFRGVNLPTAGFAAGNLPGVEGQDYDWDKESDYAYFSAKGFDIYRVALVWERLQPTLRGPLADNYLQGLLNGIIWAKQHNAKVILDIHNYGRYGGGKIISNPGSGVTNEDFNDLWVKLSNIFKDDPGIYAYDLMNEPHDMENADWHATSQAALTAIRNNGDNKLIMVPGNHWESAGEWTKYNPVPWITDPANNFIYEAHEYFDSDSSGVYAKSYDDELAANPNLAMIGAERLSVFGEWTKKYKVKGFIGEYGVPNNDPRWLDVLDNFMKKLDYYGMDGTYWAGGDRWGTYSLAIQPSDNYTKDAVQMSVLTNYLTPTVSGIVNGGAYRTSVTPVIKEGTATLSKDGGAAAAYASRTPISAEGHYSLAVTDTRNKTTTYAFTIDKVAPTVEGVADGGTYSVIVTPTFGDNEPGATAVLAKNGATSTAFASGTPISTIGLYVLTVTDAAGNETVVQFTIGAAAQTDAAIPDAHGVYTTRIPDNITSIPTDSIYGIVLGSATVRLPVSMLLAFGDLKNAAFSQAPVDAGTRQSIEAGKPANALVLQAIDLKFMIGDTAVHNLGSPVSVTIRLSDSDLAKLKSGGTPKLYYFDPATQDFINMNGVFDLAAGTVTFETNHFSTFVITLANAPTSGEPSGGTPNPAGGSNGTGGNGGNNGNGTGGNGTSNNPPADGSPTFGDLAGYDWAKDQIAFLASKGIVKGTSEGTFSPGKRVTRADFAVMLVRALGLTAAYDSSFSDLKPTDYYYDAVSIAKQLGILQGTGDGTFRPKAAITRQDMFVIAARALKLGESEVVSDLSEFTDSAEVKAYARADVGRLVAAGLVKGAGNRIRPGDSATRAETAVFIYNIIKATE
ncbi:cellulase family glycosylhydrolase [Cohnella sp. 56]|uniref:cellulase family glycosylhydrolase n=1 Tax=Cohnella sp. 56 TaxID=3113722 RepID=UPI0030E76E4A